MATGIIDDNFIFQALFVDEQNTAIAVTSPTITVFRFDRTTGVKAILAGPVAMNVAVPAETGRYTYTFAIPDSLDVGDVIYATMTGVDPSSNLPILLEETVTLVEAGGGSSSSGMTHQFVKGG